MEEAPQNKRPAVFDDLEEYEKAPQALVHAPWEMNSPELAKWYGMLISTAPDAGLTVGSDFIVYRPITGEELTQKLESAQKTYDRGRREYIDLIENGTHPTYRYAMEDYCRREGIPVPKKPESSEGHE